MTTLLTSTVFFLLATVGGRWATNVEAAARTSSEGAAYDGGGAKGGGEGTLSPNSGS